MIIFFTKVPVEVLFPIIGGDIKTVVNTSKFELTYLISWEKSKVTRTTIVSAYIYPVQKITTWITYQVF